MSAKSPVPTQQQIALAKFADDCEASGFKPAHYWRLTSQIAEARAVIAKAKGGRTMSLKPICVSCQCFYRPKKNDFAFVEGMPTTSNRSEAPRGKSAPEKWAPYKLWLGDLWECPECHHQIVVGFGQKPVAEHFQPDFPAKVERYGSTLQVNDC